MKTEATSLLIALILCVGCQTPQKQAGSSIPISRPDLDLREDGLYYERGGDMPYSGSDEAWYSTGDRAWEGAIQDGKREGKYTKWHESGGRSMVAHFKQGKPSRTWIQWYENGNPELMTEFREGKEVSTTFYDMKGSIISANRYLAQLRYRNRHRSPVYRYHYGPIFYPYYFYSSVPYVYGRGYYGHHYHRGATGGGGQSSGAGGGVDGGGSTGGGSTGGGGFGGGSGGYTGAGPSSSPGGGAPISPHDP